MPVTTFGTEQEGRFFETGYLRLGRVVPQEAIQTLCDRIDDIMLGRVRYEGLPMQLDSATGSYGDVPAQSRSFEVATLTYRRVDDLQRDPLFLAYMQHPLFRQITARLIGPDVSIFRAMFMNKPANRGTVLPWHQDIGIGWGLDANPIVTIWTALDEATAENGCMQIIPGSHTLGVLNERHFPSEGQLAQHAKEEDCIYLEAEPGEAILMHNFLLHRSGVNRVDRPRRAFSFACMDAATRNATTGETYPVIFGKNALKV